MFHSSAVVPSERLDKTGLLPSILFGACCGCEWASCSGIDGTKLKTSGNLTAGLIVWSDHVQTVYNWFWLGTHSLTTWHFNLFLLIFRYSLGIHMLIFSYQVKTCHRWLRCVWFTLEFIPGVPPAGFSFPADFRPRGLLRIWCVGEFFFWLG